MSNLILKSMKSLFFKLSTPLLLIVFVLGIAQFSHAAYQGKQQSKEVTIQGTENVTTPSSKSDPIDDDTLLLVILALLLPPLAVYLKYNEAGKPFIVNIILTLLCGLPGVIHALIHVLRK